ncbi:hypothetical protein [Allosphingosinicella sp.]|jgi:hypothetical protein|uniref:hypothetical protein n=1 Tax=Allosphingosinicella sp. TaxID=2823234 RepID=UPI002F21008F
MPRLYPEALLFCLVWIALAVAGWELLGWRAGLALSAGLFLIVMPASALTLSRTGNFALERTVRWSILAVAGLILLTLVMFS